MATTTITVGTVTKDPNETRRFIMDWSPHLEADRLLSNTVWTSSAHEELVIQSHGMVAGNTSTYVVTTGGVHGRTYILTNTVESTSGNVAEVWQRSGRVDVRQM